MAKHKLPTLEQLRKLLRYDPDTGKLYWLERTDGSLVSRAFNGRTAGNEAGTPYLGYIKIRLNGKTLYAHRLAWAMHYGEYPDGQIDHINGMPSDNRIVNLRCVTHQENMKNIKRYANNKSGKTGVFFHAGKSKWEAYIKVMKKRIHLGCFESFEDAANARIIAEKEHQFHQNHGSVRG